jgi:hypothetical protein
VGKKKREGIGGKELAGKNLLERKSGKEVCGKNQAGKQFARKNEREWSWRETTSGK